MRSALATTTRTQERPSRRLKIQQVLGSTSDGTVELLRLLVLARQRDPTLDILGIDKDSVAGFLLGRIPGPGGTLFTADSGGRIEGMLYLEPSLMESALLGHHLWTIEHLLLGPDAPDGTVEALLGYALTFLGGPLDFLSARVQASDGAAIRGLHRSGFRAVAGEAIGALANPKPSRPRLPGVTFAPLQCFHLEAVAKIAGDCRGCHPYAHDRGFDPEKVGGYLGRKLAGYIQDPFRAATVATGQGGEVLGAIAFTKTTALGEAVQRRLATLDLLCVPPAARSSGLEEVLLRHALGSLAREGAQAVIARTLVNSPGSLDHLAALQKNGFSITASNLLMHRWLKDENLPAA